MDSRKHSIVRTLLRDCIPANTHLYALIEELRREFRVTGFGNHAALKTKPSEPLQRIPASAAATCAAKAPTPL